MRTAEQNGAQQTVEYRIAVSGQMIREDWVENGEQRALIVRPDVGEAYLLFPDKGEYLVETPEDARLAANGSPTTSTEVNSRTKVSKQQADSNVLVDPVAIESDMSQATTADERTASVSLPDAKVDGHPCGVWERRSILSDGTTEITRTYKATDLEGLSIKIESESEGKNGRVRVVTETRDVQSGIPQGAFDVPSGLKRKPR